MMDYPEPETDERLPIALLIAGSCAFIAMVLGLAAPHDGSVWRMPHVLEERVAAALTNAGFPGLDIEMDGQRAILRGMVESEADIEAARRAALTAAGAGGAWAGGVTSVDASGVAVGPIERPYVWSARRDGNRIVLSGAVPSENVRADLVQVARAVFTNADPVNEMRVAGGAPSHTFAQVARDSVRMLARLSAGEVRIVDTQIAFIGDGDPQSVEALRAAFEEPPAPFRSRLAVTIDGLDVEHPELQGLNLATGDAETCERAFDRLMERNVINFAPNSATIDPSSRRVLDSLASVALRCDRFAIEVAGHTDNQGAREMNMELSRARADAVANYLASQGVAEARLSARGYGPDNPRVSNATPTGQAINRRIEFYVSGAPT
ncbi:MAG TPA: OmpA family protein [Vitreimonas sp.]|uniref:OmpA family protein n=1 Tax=Vitreimonas sp. TaxID=3069702 RepID=UPI002D46CDD2|nr:OmpA family protein [Vitreimonas sp.]HYD89222.1 OmpA family protein [Vitreimonas sp.]